MSIRGTFTRFDSSWSIRLLLILYLKFSLLFCCTRLMYKRQKEKKANLGSFSQSTQYNIVFKAATFFNEICVLLVADQLQIFFHEISSTADSSNISFLNNWIKLGGIIVNRRKYVKGVKKDRNVEWTQRLDKRLKLHINISLMHSSSHFAIHKFYE